MAPKWGEKLQGKLSDLTEASSKESMQSLAMWIWFNRKHKDTFVTTMRARIESSADPTGTVNSGHLSILLSVLSEVFLLHLKQADKWEGALDLRVTLAEALILPFAGSAFDAAKIEALLPVWDASNVFSGPTLINQIRSKLSSSATSSSPGPKSTDNQAQTPPTTEVTQPLEDPSTDVPVAPPTTGTIAQSTPEALPVVAEPLKVAIPFSEGEALAKKPRLSRTSSVPATPSSSKEVVYDFDATGIAAAPVDAKDLVDHCRNIATLQIARDLQSEAAVDLSGMLQSLPEPVRVFIAESAEQDSGGTVELSDVTAREFSATVEDKLLDVDLPEQLQSVQAYRDVIARQQIARERLREALISSRCQFGADEAAAAFFAVDNSELKHRAQLLVDAMDLEGLEVQPITMIAAQEEELPPLTWYQAAVVPSD